MHLLQVLRQELEQQKVSFLLCFFLSAASARGSVCSSQVNVYNFPKANIFVSNFAYVFELAAHNDTCFARAFRALLSNDGFVIDTCAVLVI